MILKRLKRKAAEIASPLLWKSYFSKPNGIKWRDRKCAVTIGFDLDYPEDLKATPKLLESLSSFQISASFACIGKFVEMEKRIFSEIIAEGHEIVNHSYSHPNGYWNEKEFFNKISVERQREEVESCHKVVKSSLDYEMRGFRSPHFGDLHTKSVYPILQDLKYLYSSSTILTKTSSKGLPYYPSNKDSFKSDAKQANNFSVLELPVMSCPSHYYPVFDSYHCFRTNPPAHPKEGEFEKLFRKAILMGLKENFYVNFYFDPMDVGGNRNKEFENCLEFLHSLKKEAWITTCLEVSKEWIRTH